MRGLDGRKAPRGGLVLDGETAGRAGLDCKTRQVHERRTLADDRPCAVPCRIDEKDDEPASAKRVGGKASADDEGACSRIQQNGVVRGIVDQGANPRVGVEAHALDDFTVGEVQARQSPRRAFLMAELLRVHEEDDPRARLHGSVCRTKAAGRGTPASVTGFSWHDYECPFCRCPSARRLLLQLMRCSFLPCSVTPTTAVPE